MEEVITTEPKIISIEGKCGVGKSTWLKNHGVDTEETVDFKVDERTHSAEHGMIPLEEQLIFVTHKIDQFKRLLVELDKSREDIYIDGSMLYNTSYGAAYYWWYFTSTGDIPNRDKFVSDYLSICYNLIDVSLPDGWNKKLESIILIPEKEKDIREGILKRGRPSEVANIDNMLKVNEFFMEFLIKILDRYDIKYSYETIVRE